MLVIYFKITNIKDNDKKAIYSNKVHNYLFETLGAIKPDKKTRFFITTNTFNLERISNSIKSITNNNVDVLVFKVDDYAGWMETSFWDKIE